MSNFQLTGTTKIESFYNIYYDTRFQKILLRIPQDQLGIPIGIYPMVKEIETKFGFLLNDTSLASSRVVYRFELNPNGKYIDLTRTDETTRGSARALWDKHYENGFY